MLYRNMKKIIKMLKKYFDDVINLVLYTRGLHLKIAISVIVIIVERRLWQHIKL